MCHSYVTTHEVRLLTKIYYFVTLVLQYTSVSVCLSVDLLFYLYHDSVCVDVLTCSKTDFSFCQFSVSRMKLTRQDCVDCRGSTA